jgi:hypothetical protein
MKSEITKVYSRQSFYVVEGETWDGFSLRNGELGILRITKSSEKNGYKQIGSIEIKVGDGKHSWDELPYPNTIINMDSINSTLETLTLTCIALENRCVALEEKINSIEGK